MAGRDCPTWLMAHRKRQLSGAGVWLVKGSAADADDQADNLGTNTLWEP